IKEKSSRIKKLVKKLPCLGIPDPNADLIIETDASDIGYGGVLKQKLPNSSKEQVVKYHSGIWHPSQQKYSTVKKEILSIKPELLPIMTLEPYMIKENLKDLIAHIFPKSFHYLSNDFSKSQRFYEFILVDTDSTEITHNKDDQGNILFSKIKIMNILSPQDWDQSLFDSKSFSRSFNPTGYTYYDYIDAWYNTLYINPEKHSWFVWFKKGIPLKFPKWFIKWFYHFGPLPEIFPQQVTDVYNYFKESSTFVLGYRMISFVASQSITWILAWDYMIISQYESEITDMKMLTRKIKVKWWRKFNIELISKAKISEWLKNNKARKGLPPKLELNKESLFLMEKQRLMAELAASTTAEEFYNKARSLQGGSSQRESDEGSSQSNPYLRNEDMFD
ncbi:Enzymatic polyprotein, partial [Mucuna pruriens]